MFMTSDAARFHDCSAPLGGEIEEDWEVSDFEQEDQEVSNFEEEDQEASGFEEEP